MPHYPILQPDGRLAVWSTIVDNFTAFDCTQAEAVSILQQWHTGDLAAVTAKVAAGEIPFDHWHDWADCVAWAQFMHGAEDGTVKEALARTTDHMAHRYIAQHVATCKAETAADDLRAALAAALAAAQRSSHRAAELESICESQSNRIAELEQRTEAHDLRAALAAATAERDHARRHVELLREELDAVPVAALDALADSADAVPAKIIEWLAWSTLGAHWQPADSPCPDCGANALAVAIHADGTIEQWLCDACGYVAAEKSGVQP